ncbi:MAG: hypothetical protein ACRDST_23400 [Pseudonocardiaceae bacterium]
MTTRVANQRRQILPLASVDGVLGVPRTTIYGHLIKQTDDDQPPPAAA